MSAAVIRGVVRRLGSPTNPSDADLVAAFAARRDPDTFAALVDRHGPTVRGVCLRLLGHTHDAEDAFQAVFLVLALKAKTIRPPGAVGGWLYGVAVRTANKAKVAAARRRRREMIAATAQANRGCEPPGSSPETTELQAALDAELAQLPEALRAVVILCDLHGKTRAEAAAELGCPEGTVAARLHRARKKLADALTRRGLALPVAGLASVLVPATLSATVVRSALAVVKGSAPPVVLALAREVTRSMTATKSVLAFGMLSLVAGGLLAAGSMMSAPVSDAPAQPPPAEAKVTAPSDAKPASPWREAKVLEQMGWLAGSVAYSADGKTLFIGGSGGFVRAYDTTTWKPRWDHDGEGHFAAVAVAPDGKQLAITAKDGVRFLDAATGKVGDMLEEKGSEPLAVGWFPDAPVFDDTGKLLATSRKVIFANARGQFVKTWLAWPQVSTITATTGKQPADDYAIPLAISPDGKRVVVTGPIDRKTGKNVLWAWSAGSGEANKLLEGHKATVTSAAWSADGKTIVTGDADGLVITWDATTFKEKSRLELPARVRAVAISPNGKHTAAAVARTLGRDGRLGDEEEVLVWDATAPLVVPTSLFNERMPGGLEHHRGVASLAFAPDGKSLAAAFANPSPPLDRGNLHGQVRVFTLAAEEPPPPDYVSHVEFSPDGKRYLVVSGKGIRVHDSANDKPLWTAPGEGARFTPDGKTVLVLGEKVTYRDAATGTQAAFPHPRPKSKWGWQRVAFSPDGKRYAAHTGLEARVYDTATGFEPVRLDDQTDQIQAGTTSGVTSRELFWSPDGKKVAAIGVQIQGGPFGFTTTGAAVWDAETGNRLHVFGSNVEVPQALAFSADSKLLAATFKDRVVLYDARTFKEVRNLGDQQSATALAWAPDGKHLAVGIRLPIRHGGDVQNVRVLGYHTQVRLIDTESGKTVKAFDGFEGKTTPTEATKLPVTVLAFSADGKKLIAGTGLTSVVPIYWGVVAHPNDLPKAGEVKVWSVEPANPPPAPETGQRWRDETILTDHGALVNGVAWSPDGKTFAAANENNVTCWDAATRKVLWKYQQDAPFGALAFSPDGKHVCVGSKVDVTRLDAKTGKPNPWIEVDELQFGEVYALAYRPDGTRLAGSSGYRTKVLELVPNGEVVNTPTIPMPKKGERGPFPRLSAGVAWSKDGKTLAIITHMKREGKWPLVLWSPNAGLTTTPAHDDPLTAVAWSKDGKLIVSGDEKGLVIAWDAMTRKELWRKAFKGRDDTIGRVNALAISPADNTIAVAVSLGSGKGPERVALLEPKEGEYVQQLMRWDIPVSSVAWSPDGQFLLTGCGAVGLPIKLNEPAMGEVVVWERKP